MKDDEGWKMNDDGWWFQAVEGFCFMTDERTDICDCRVAFATENPWHTHTDEPVVCVVLCQLVYKFWLDTQIDNMDWQSNNLSASWLMSLHKSHSNQECPKMIVLDCPNYNTMEERITSEIYLFF